MAQLRQFAFKKFGCLRFDAPTAQDINQPAYHTFIKILFLHAGAHIQVDFKSYRLEQDALFFINASQWYKLDTESDCRGTMVYYNRDFYCVEIHDAEVACDGILFHNVYEIPVVLLDEAGSAEMQRTLAEINRELEGDDDNMEEMLRVFLKQIIIKATRIWKKQHQAAGVQASGDIEFLRRFSQLVEWNYTRYHGVGDYATLLNITPKALHKRIAKHSPLSPNDLIKERIMLEAKRLLAHTDLQVKEIAYKLGYDDPAYFVRLFTKQAMLSPQLFRKQYQQQLQENPTTA